MSWTVARAAVDLLVRSNHTSPLLGFYGGEPLLERALLRRVVTYFESRLPANCSPGYSIATNGTLLDADTLGLLASRNCRTFLAWDGTAAAQSARGRGSYRVISQKVRYLASQWPGFLENDVKLSLTLSSRNLPQLAASIRLMLRAGASRIVIAPLMTHDQAWRPEMISTLDDQMSEVADACLAHVARSHTIPVSNLRPRSARLVTQTPAGGLCAVARGDALVVDVDGGVFTCPALVPSYQSLENRALADLSSSLRLGDVRESDLLSKRAAYHRRVHHVGLFHRRESKWSSYRRCKECDVRSECRACPLATVHIPGVVDPHRVSDLQCAFQLVIAKHRAALIEAVSRRKLVIADRGFSLLGTA